MIARTLKYQIAVAALLASVVGSQADTRRGDFTNALWYSSKCPAYELDPDIAMGVAVSIGLPDTPSSIIVAENEGEQSMLSNVASFAGRPEASQLPQDVCRWAYSMFGPDGTKIKGLMRIRTKG